VLLKRVRFIARACVRVCVCVRACEELRKCEAGGKKRVCYFCAFVAKSLGLHPPRYTLR